MLKARSRATRSLCRTPAGLQLQITQLESNAEFGRRSLGWDAQDFVQSGMIDPIGRMRQAVEVLAQNLARQKNRADAKASSLNLGRNRSEEHTSELQSL